MTKYTVAPFSFESNQIRTIVISDELWFVAQDVCSALKIQNVTQAIERLDNDERSMFNIGRQGEVNIINESGMYTLVLRCRDAIKSGTLPHRFRKWVTNEVLPAIRKTGSYSFTITPEQAGELHTLIAERFPIGTDRPYAWGRFNNHFRLASYKHLPLSKFSEACEYIRTMPSRLESMPSRQYADMVVIDLAPSDRPKLTLKEIFNCGWNLQINQILVTLQKAAESGQAIQVKSIGRTRDEFGSLCVLVELLLSEVKDRHQNIQLAHRLSVKTQQMLGNFAF